MDRPFRPCECDRAACPLCYRWYYAWGGKDFAEPPFPEVPPDQVPGVSRPGPARFVSPPAVPPIAASPTRPRVVATLAVGEVGKALLGVSGPIFAEYAERVGADYHPILLDKSEYPLGEKFRARALFDVWERVLFLDADIILDPGCPDLFGEVPEGAVGIHDDLPHLPAGTDWLRAESRAIAESQGWEVPADFATCLNTGVVVAGREHRRMYDPPPRPYPVFHTAEQDLINLNIHRLGLPVHRLPFAFNAQWLWAGKPRPAAAHVWHFARPAALSEGARFREMAAALKELWGRDVELPKFAREPVEVPEHGPGTELKRLLEQLGVRDFQGCGCQGKVAAMNRWGVEGCRARRAEIAAWLRESRERAGWGATLLAVGRAVASGLAFRLDPLDPFGSLVDEAIRRAARP